MRDDWAGLEERAAVECSARMLAMAAFTESERFRDEVELEELAALRGQIYL